MRTTTEGFPRRIALKPEDLVLGRGFVTEQKGYAAERIVFLGLNPHTGRFNFLNEREDRPFSADPIKVYRGRVGHSRITRADHLASWAERPKDDSMKDTKPSAQVEPQKLGESKKLDDMEADYKIGDKLFPDGEAAVQLYGPRKGLPEFDKIPAPEVILSFFQGLVRKAETNADSIQLTPESLLRAPHFAVVELRKRGRTVSTVVANLIGNVVRGGGVSLRESFIFQSPAFPDGVCEVPVNAVLKGRSYQGVRISSLYAQYPKPPQ